LFLSRRSSSTEEHLPVRPGTEFHRPVVGSVIERECDPLWRVLYLHQEKTPPGALSWEKGRSRPPAADFCLMLRICFFFVTGTTQIAGAKNPGEG